MPTTWPQGTGPTSFDSTDLLPRLRDTLVPLLDDAHASDPFTPSDPRANVRRALSVVEAVGLTGITIRGVVDVSGVEVDHVWLAVTREERDDQDASGPDLWVLDPSFPLHRREFTALLGGWVAGIITADELVQAAAGAGVDDRVVGTFPRGTGYRGEPVWSLTRR